MSGSDYTTGKAHVAVWRWLLPNRPGRYVVVVWTDGFDANFDAVVDDFGNLVRVA